MMKFLSTTIGVLITTVVFLYYLIQNSNFLPMDIRGNYLPVNIGVFIFLVLVAILCFTVLAIFGLRQIFAKQVNIQLNIRFAIKYGFLLTLGILVVYLLHFFHILTFPWGMAILIVVILSLFVI